MAPFMSDDDVPGFEPDPYDGVVPDLPAELVEHLDEEAARYAAGEWIWVTEPDCECPDGCFCAIDPSLRRRTPTGIPRSLAERFEREFRAAESAKAATWRAAVALHDLVTAERGEMAAEHVGSELAVRMGAHPRTGMSLMCTALRVVKEVPRLVELVEAGCIGERHVNALLDEVGKWTDGDAEQSRLLLEQTLARCEERADRYGWPTPGEMRKALQRVALLNDMRAAEKKRRSVAERRGVSLWQSGAGAAMLTIEGPDASLILAYRAIQERAEAMKHLEGDTRTREQREFDATVEMLTVDADMPPGGGISARPTTDVDGHPIDLVVRGAHIAVVAPYSVTQGGELELAEVPGFGYLLPSTTRELVEHADRFTRVAVDAETGEVLAVDDAVPGPDRARRRARSKTEPPDEPDVGSSDGDGSGGFDPPTAPTAPGPAGMARPEPSNDSELSVSSAVALLRELAARRVIWRDLSSSAYRVPGRLRRHVEHRDRTCCFPGCTVPGYYCDVDHREEWPRGGTHKDNCHVLCRRHHRAKQLYFADVTIDPTTGDTCWTTFEGNTYRRPPPRY